MKIGILEPKYFSIKVIEKLNKLGKVSLYHENSDFIKFISDKEIIYTRLKFFFNEELIKKCLKLKYLVSPTTGLNHINQTFCNYYGVKIISLKGLKELKKIKATPEHTFGLILSLLRNYKYYFNLKEFKLESDRLSVPSFEISKQKIGIIGFGRVGKELSKYFNAFGSEISFYELNALSNEQRLSYDFCRESTSIEELIKNSEIVVVSASYEGRIILGRNHLNLLKGKYLINTSRGENIDENHLIELINKDHFKGVAIDNIQDEQFKKNNLKLITNLHKSKPNFIFTPHISGATITSLNHTEMIVTKELITKIRKDGL